MYIDFDLDTLSDEDFDFLCDLGYDIILSQSDFLEENANSKSDIKLIQKYLNQERYSSFLSLNLPNPKWWQKEDDLEDLFQEEEDEGLVKLELSLKVGKKNADINENNVEQLEDAIVLAAVIFTLKTTSNIKQTPNAIINPVLQWLPERNNI